MKQYFTLFFLLFTTIFFLQCRLPTYYIKRDNPEAAFRFAANRLKGKKQKTKHLQTLEYGYNTSYERDIALINKLKNKKDLNSWKSIHYINQQLLARQEKVEQLLPLASEEGFRPYIPLYPVREWEEESFWKVTDLYLTEIRNLLNGAKRGQKLKARKANDYLFQLNKQHGYDGPELIGLEDSTYVLGTAYFFIDIYSSSHSNNLFQIIDWISENDFYQKNKWKEIHTFRNEYINYDFAVELNVMNYYVSGDQISSSCQSYSKEIEVGKKEVKDTSGKVTYEPIYQTIQATVQEFNLSKNASINADLRVIDLKTGGIIWRNRIYGSDSFSDSYCQISGDCRATTVTCSSFHQSFPNDESMLKNCATGIRRNVLSVLKKIDVVE
ncbi:MAG: hypothetical protein R2788_11200 [Saprospiraceae bacterium]